MDSPPPTINRLYISFSENGCERSLARIDQNSIGRLVIALNKGKFYRPNHEIAQVDGSIKLTKYTIQPSADSIDGNQIHLTSLTTSKDVHGYHFTEAIKKYNRFAPIFICRSSNLSNAIDVKDISSKPHFSIGKYDTQHFTLFFGMFVGSNTNVFDPSERIPNMNFKQINFRAFSIILMWTFMDLPSHTTGDIMSPFTTKDTSWLTDDEIIRMRNLMIGFDQYECLAWFTMFTERFADKYAVFLHRNEKLDQLLSDYIDWSRFYNAGEVTTLSRQHAYLFTLRRPWEARRLDRFQISERQDRPLIAFRLPPNLREPQ